MARSTCLSSSYVLDAALTLCLLYSYSLSLLHSLAPLPPTLQCIVDTLGVTGGWSVLGYFLTVVYHLTTVLVFVLSLGNDPVWTRRAFRWCAYVYAAMLAVVTVLIVVGVIHGVTSNCRCAITCSPMTYSLTYPPPLPSPPHARVGTGLYHWRHSSSLGHVSYILFCRPHPWPASVHHSNLYPM